jgi:hypothetical protein
VVTHANNPGYSEGGDQNDHSLRLVQPKKSYQKRLGVMAHTCNPRYSGGRVWEDSILRPVFTKKLARLNQKNWAERCVPVIPAMWQV